MSDDASPILVSTSDRVAHITLNGPADGNRWTADMLAAFESVIDGLNRDEDTHIVTIRGAGEEYFSWGALDPKIRGAMPKQAVVDFVLRSARLTDALAALPQIVVAAVNGRARGMGVELALACDIRLVSERATIQLPEAGMGGIPGCGGPARLPAVVGHARALELLCTGREVAAEELVRIGFALAAFPHERLAGEVAAFARAAAQQGPIALRGAKRISRERLGAGLDAARALSDELRAGLEWSRDVDEAIAAHREGRKPRFTGR
jgi:enoyl-CoA hydratase/carnithine racemase